MFRISLLSFIFLLILFVLNLEVQGSISPIENSIKSTDISCVQALQENKYFAETETEMKRKGYGKSDIAGLDHVMENLRWVQSLRDRLRNDTSNDPHTLHIPEFADLIDVHIDFIEESIRSQKSNNKADKLKLLKLFKSEAQFHKNSKTVTYRWWFNFNLRLSFLTNPYYVQMITDNELEHFYRNSAEYKDYTYEYYTSDHIEKISFLLDSFPKRIMIPTIDNLGIMSINKAYGMGVHFVGLKKKSIYADGLLMYPDMFFWHDIYHIRKKDFNDPPRFLFHFQQKLVDLPKYQRRVVERIDFQLTHELKLSLKEAEMKYIIEGDSSPLMRSLSSGTLFGLVPRLTGAYGFVQFSRLISEVNQELIHRSE